MQPRRLRRAVIKEEFVALTGDYIKAIILNQFIYWSERVSDFDEFIKEEKARAEENDQEINIELRNGWIYKTADELSEETMLHLARSTMRKHIKYLVDNKWLEERTNPENKWDKTTQYRVNLVNINNDLMKLGYILQDYRIEIPFSPNNTPNNASMKPRSSEIESRSSEIEPRDSKIESQNSRIESRMSKNKTAIPEITTEITTENVVVVGGHPSDKQDPIVQNVIDSFREATGNDLTEDFVKDELLKKWPADYILQKIEVCKHSRINESATGFLIRALEEDYPLPKPAARKPSTNKSTKRSTRHKASNSYNLTEEEKQKKKQMIRELYLT